MSFLKTSADNNLTGLGSFLRDKAYLIIIAAIVTLIAGAFLIAFRINTEMVITLGALWITFIISTLLIEYMRKISFYHDLVKNLDHLDQAYLVLETLAQPKFYDGVILYEALYRINKSMLEDVARYRTQAKEFQDYAELWIHEVKTPLATLSLMSRDPKINEQIKRMDDYVEQILFFTRAENAERDYLIRAVNLNEVIKSVALRNREILQMQQIELEVAKLDHTIHTDAKWLEFILNQVLNNSIKYDARKVQVTTTQKSNIITLQIRDDGIGISSKDLPNVFKKSFTGQNGHHGGAHQSTGMGLYLAHTLCQKLGHRINISSVEGKWTLVEITFMQHDFYTDVA